MAKIHKETKKYLKKILKIDNSNKGDISKGMLLLKILSKKDILKKRTYEKNKTIL